MDPLEENKLLMKTVGTVISRIAMFVCISFVFVMGMNTCSVDKEVIIQCEESCGTLQGMKEVTGTRCECAAGSRSDSRSEEWVIPRN